MRQISDAIGVLGSCPLFRGFTAEELLSSLVSAGAQVRCFSRGETLLGPDSPRRELLFLLEGEAKVCRGKDRSVEMSLLSSGAVFGVATLFSEGDAFPNEVVAETACSALLCPRAWAERLLAGDARFARNYIAFLSERILFLNRRISTFTADDAVQRLRGMLRDYWLAQGAGSEFTLPCSYTQLAALLHIGRASLYRALERLEAESLFTRSGRVFRLTPQSGRRFI